MHPKQQQAIYDDLRENDMTGMKKQPPENYPDRSHIRVIIFKLADGTCTGFNYQYLISTSCSADSNTLELDFTTHNVRLTGIRLDLLYQKLSEHLPRIIKCRNERYNLILNDQPVVNEIIIAKK